MTFVRDASGAIADVKCPLWLYQLLAVAKLGKVRLGPEDRLAIDFSTRLRQDAMNGRLIGTFTHIPHEVGGGGGRGAEVRYAVAKAMGLVPGSGDYVFTRPGGSLWLEAKRPKLTKAVHGRSDSGGTLNPDQRRFQQWCEREAVPYFVFTSVDDGYAILKQEGFLR